MRVCVEPFILPMVWFPLTVAVGGFPKRLSIMPRPYPPEFRQHPFLLLREGHQFKQTAGDLGIHWVTLHFRLRQGDI